MNVLNGICISPNNEFIFITDTVGGGIHVLNANDGTYVRPIVGQSGNDLHSPTSVCISPSGRELFISEDLLRIDEDGGFVYSADIKVFNALDGSFIRTINIGHRTRTSDICISHDGELLFTADFNLHRINVFRTDGTPLRTIGKRQLRHPNSICLSKEGELYVTDSSNSIKVFRLEDGSHVRSIGVGRSLSVVYMSPFGELFISHPKHDRNIEVFQTDGTRVRTIDQTAFSRGLCVSDKNELFAVSKNTQTGEYCVKVFQN